MGVICIDLDVSNKTLINVAVECNILLFRQALIADSVIEQVRHFQCLSVTRSSR